MRYRHVRTFLLGSLLLAAAPSAAAGTWSQTCSPGGAQPPLLTLVHDGFGGVRLEVSHGPALGQAFVLARISDQPVVPAPRSGLPGCAGVAAGTLVEVLTLDGNGEAMRDMDPLFLDTNPILSVVALPPSGTLADTLLSNSVAVLDATGDTLYQSGEVLITEIMKDPSAVSDTRGEWVELHNPGDQPVDVEGWVLADLDGDQYVLFDDWNGIVIPAGGYLVLGRDDDPAENGGVQVDHVYSGFTLGNTDDEVVLRRPDAVQVDAVVYSDANLWPDVAGASMSLDPAFHDAVLGDHPLNWCPGQTPWTGGVDLGTPGQANQACP